MIETSSATSLELEHWLGFCPFVFWEKKALFLKKKYIISRYLRTKFSQKSFVPKWTVVSLDGQRTVPGLRTSISRSLSFRSLDEL
jgi:hypothetical protein